MRRLQVARERAARSAGVAPAATDVDRILASMGSKCAAEAVASAAASIAKGYVPRLTGVGEEVWDPTVTASCHQFKGCASLAIELQRSQALRRLQAGLEAELLRILGPKLVASLEVHSSQTLRNGNSLVDRWLAERRLAAVVQSEVPSSTGGLKPCDPLLPLPYSSAHDVPELVAELQRAGADATRAAEAAVALGRVAADALEWFRRRCAKAPPLGVVSLRESPGQSGAPSHDMLEVRCGRVAHKINRVHCAKLLELYQRAQDQEVEQSDQGFVSALCCLLVRYESLGGAGMQAALNGQAFDVLKTCFGVAAECFASPLNCRFEGFCSAFPDIDMLFGGRGDFFNVFGGRCILRCSAPSLV